MKSYLMLTLYNIVTIRDQLYENCLSIHLTSLHKNYYFRLYSQERLCSKTGFTDQVTFYNNDLIWGKQDVSVIGYTNNITSHFHLVVYDIPSIQQNQCTGAYT